MACRLVTDNHIHNIFLLLGGLGLFLYGMDAMSRGLKDIAGARMRIILQRFTANRFLGFLVGMIVTAVIQSSTATSMMLLGFVNAGAMNLTQSIGVLIGANVGTTFTAFLLTFRIDPYAPMMVFAGLMMFLFFKNKNVKVGGYILLGIGFLFFGLTIMGLPLRFYAATEGFQYILSLFQNPFLAVMAGILATSIIQSSTAVTAIIVAMSGGDAPVIADFSTVVYMIVGANVGTASTALLASLAGTRESKRVAVANVIFRLINCFMFIVVIMIFPGIITWFENTWVDGGLRAAMLHLIYNAACAAVLIFFTKQMSALTMWILPEQEVKDARLSHIAPEDSDETQTAEEALASAHSELCRMGNIVIGNLRLSLDACYTGEQRKAEVVFRTEDMIDFIKQQIISWLVRIKNIETEHDMQLYNTYLRAASDLERIGDYAENFAENNIFEHNTDNPVLPKVALDELKNLGDTVMELFKLSMNVFETRNTANLQKIYDLEQKIDALVVEYFDNHVARVKEFGGDPHGGLVFTSMVSDLERCADHAYNIAYYYPIMNEGQNESDLLLQD